MRWIKRGHIYAPDGNRWWAKRNASFPTAHMRDDVVRIYFTALDRSDIGRTGYIDVDPEDPRRVIRESKEPVLDVGELGAFDDCGANVFSVVDTGEVTYLYYQGWQRTQRTPYLIFSGLAIDRGGEGKVHKHSRTPILDRIQNDPYVRGAPYVMATGDCFTMWYVSCRHWVRDQHGLHYEVAIRRATSGDGIVWVADDDPCVRLEAPDEYAVGRPSVLWEEGIYRMWYSIRSFTRPYRIGYAESHDGMHWTRRDSEAAIEPSREGWDSEMICYSHVLRVGDKLLMLYNGNRHGASGFGYAEAVA